MQGRRRYGMKMMLFMGNVSYKSPINGTIVKPRELMNTASSSVHIA